jgi:hypothetical protein
VLVILPQDVLWQATVQAGDILQQGLEFRPHTRGDVQTRENGVYNGEVRVNVFKRGIVVGFSIGYIFNSNSPLAIVCALKLILEGEEPLKTLVFELFLISFPEVHLPVRHV